MGIGGGDPTTLKQRARMSLVEDALRARPIMSCADWLDVVRDSEAAHIVGTQELRAIINVIWHAE